MLRPGKLRYLTELCAVDGCGGTLETCAERRDTPPATKAAILDAARAVVVERGQNYGDVAENFARIARRWHAHLLNRFGIDVPLDPVSVALMMDDVKSARLEHQPDHRDSWVDKAGYAACGGEIAGGAGGKGGR